MVDYHHNFTYDADGDVEVYCQRHAFEDGRGECSCCFDYFIKVSVEDGDGKFLPSFAKGQLDEEGYCAEHP
ncbi:hypothetical protein [Methylogaea oryzae]|uniref:hypothetical protein n=1 Tax=Methylogaea oryzae TaxID=1295382 RepID=UPI0012E2AB1D|nr:hypothetical protein [Methylogaea oryzae]